MSSMDVSAKGVDLPLSATLEGLLLRGILGGRGVVIVTRYFVLLSLPIIDVLPVPVCQSRFLGCCEVYGRAL